MGIWWAAPYSRVAMEGRKENRWDLASRWGWSKTERGRYSPSATDYTGWSKSFAPTASDIIPVTFEFIKMETWNFVSATRSNGTTSATLQNFRGSSRKGTRNQGFKGMMRGLWITLSRLSTQHASLLARRSHDTQCAGALRRREGAVLRMCRCQRTLCGVLTRNKDPPQDDPKVPPL